MIWVRGRRPGGVPGIFVLVALVDSVGTGMFLAGSAIFFVRAVGLSAAQVGVGLAIAGGIGLVTAVPVGAIADRLGARTVLVAVQCWRAAAQVGLAFATGPVAFTVLASCLAMAGSSAVALTQAVVSDEVGAERRLATMATMRSLRNVGFSIGALAVAPLLAAGTVWSYRTIMLGDGLSFVLAAMFLSRVRAGGAPARRPSQSTRRALLLVRDWRYAALTGLNSILCLHMTLLSILIPLWTISSTAAPPSLIPVLVVINTVLVVAVQVRVSRTAEGNPGGVRALRRAGLAMAACCVVVAATAGTVWWLSASALVIGVVLLTFGELWQTAGGWELSYAFASPSARAQHLAVFNLGTTVQSIVGPALLVPAVIRTGAAGWLTLGMLFTAVAALATPVVAALAQAQSAPAAATTLAGDAAKGQDLADTSPVGRQ